MALKPRYQKFVNSYNKTGNITQAALDAGYSKKSAHSQGSRLLKNVKVQSELKKIQTKATEKAQLSAAEVLNEIKKLAFVNLATAYNEDGTLKSPHEMPLDVQSALQSLETNELFVGSGKNKRKIGNVSKIRLTDKVRALEMLAKHFKLLTELHEHSGKDGAPLIVLTLPKNGSEAVVPPETPKAPPEND